MPSHCNAKSLSRNNMRVRKMYDGLPVRHFSDGLEVWAVGNWELRLFLIIRELLRKVLHGKNN